MTSETNRNKIEGHGIVGHKGVFRIIRKWGGGGEEGLRPSEWTRMVVGVTQILAFFLVINFSWMSIILSSL